MKLMSNLKLLLVIFTIFLFVFGCQRHPKKRYEKNMNETKDVEIKKELKDRKTVVNPKPLPKMKPEIKIEYKQVGYGKMVISLFKNEEGKKIYLAKRNVVILLGDREYIEKSDDDGKVEVKIPEELQESLNKIILKYNGEKFIVPYKKRRVEIEYKVAFQIEEIKNLKINVFKKKYELRFLPNCKESESCTQKILISKLPYNGEVNVIIAEMIEKNAEIRNGEATIILNKNEIMELIKTPVVEVQLDTGYHYKDTVELPNLSGKVELQNPNIKRTSFECVVYNGTFEKKKILVRAGYVRYGDEWFVGKITSHRYFSEEEIVLKPGEKKKLILTFDEPVWGERKLKYIYKIIE